MSLALYPEHIYQPTLKQLRARGKQGGKASGAMQSMAARERCRQAASDELAAIDHETARETVAQLLRVGLLDRWIDGIYRRADETGYKRGYLHEKRNQPSTAAGGARGYGQAKARARAWMAAQVGEFTSAQLGQAVGVSVDAAATYTYRAMGEGLLTQRSVPGSGGRVGRRFYRWRTA